MTIYVNRVHKVPSSDGVHQHIGWVCREDGGGTATPAEVIASMDRGNDWRTRASDGTTAKIKPLTFCPASGCLHKPYITTAPDHSAANNLDNLPPC